MINSLALTMNPPIPLKIFMNDRIRSDFLDWDDWNDDIEYEGFRAFWLCNCRRVRYVTEAKESPCDWINP